MGNPKLIKYGPLSIEIHPNDSNLLYFDEIDQWELTLNFGFGAKTSASKRVSYWRSRLILRTVSILVSFSVQKSDRRIVIEVSNAPPLS